MIVVENNRAINEKCKCAQAVGIIEVFSVPFVLFSPERKQRN